MKKIALLVVLAVVLAGGISFAATRMNAAACGSIGAISMANGEATFRDDVGVCRLGEVDCASRFAAFVKAKNGNLIIPKFSCPE